MSVASRHNAKITGAGERAMVFAHGFGCDQNMWRFVYPAFEKDFRIEIVPFITSGPGNLIFLALTSRKNTHRSTATLKMS